MYTTIPPVSLPIQIANLNIFVTIRPKTHQNSNAMSLVSGPGRGGGNTTSQEDLELYIDTHVQYIKTLDSVRLFGLSLYRCSALIY